MILSTPHATDLALAQRAALAGAALGLRYFQRVTELPVDLKADGSIVTEADRMVEQTVRSILLTERPDDACLGEETGESAPARRRWILDGIDGTAVFVQGDPSWQTLIALEQDGVITVAVCSVPARGRVWWATRGGGTFVGEIEAGQLVRSQQCRVATGVARVSGSRLGVVPYYDSLAAHYRAMVDGLMEAAVNIVWPVHPALQVASGELDVAVQLEGKIWDYAAPSLIVQEAGGVFTGAQGQPHPVFGNAIYAANAELHAEALALLR